MIVAFLPWWTRLVSCFGNGRWFVMTFFAMLAIPASLHIVFPSWTWSYIGNRLPHSFPPMPRTMGDLGGLAAGIDAWIGDRHGLRQELLTVNGAIRWHVFGDVRAGRLVVGRNGRVFLGAHDGHPENSLILDICGGTEAAARIDVSSAAIEGLLARARTDGFDPYFLIIPTAARLYPEDLPPPLEARCAGRAAPVDRIASNVATPNTKRILYPLALMSDLKSVTETIPSRNFHWAGETPLRVLERLAEQHMELRPAVDKLMLQGRQLTDLAVLNPGMFEFITVENVDFTALGVRACDRAACGLIQGVSENGMRPVYRWLRDGPGEPVLIVGDSFAEAFAPLVTLYSAEVWFIHSNALSSVPPEQRDALMNQLRDRFAGHKLIFLYHDYGALTSVLSLTDWLWPKAAAR